MKTSAFLASLAIGAMLCCSQASAEDKSATTAPVAAPAAKPAATAVAPSPAQQAAMQEMMKLASPGESHKLLEPLVGSWDYTVRSWMKPDAAPQESKGASTARLILGNRFLQEEVTGTMDMGSGPISFEGLGVLGYDNMAAEYTSVWADNMVTSMMISKGTYDATTKTITFKGEMNCPMTGKKNTPFRSELKIDGPDSHTYTMYSMDEAGKEFKMMEVAYSRKK